MAENLSTPSLSSYATALVILPPPHIQRRINAFRTGNDKSFPRWTAHLTLLFPFVQPELLPTASSLIREGLSKKAISPFSIKLDKVSKFKQREYDTVYLGISEDRNVHSVHHTLAEVFDYTGRPFVPHLILGQAQYWADSSAFLHDKGCLLIQGAIEWEMCSVVILRQSDAKEGQMDIYDEIPFASNVSPISPLAIAGLLPATYHLRSSHWSPSKPIPHRPSKLHIATFNVLHDLNHPLSSRFPRLLSTILGVQPVPDILCLQEMTDEMLQRLLLELTVQSNWRWCTHDPSSVLPSERNVVVLARDNFGFTWEPVKLSKHKHAVLISLPIENNPPLIVAAVHLTAGLQAIQYQNKLEQLNALIAVLQQRFHDSPWIIAGDFNLSQAVPLAISDYFQDVWLYIHGSEDGSTYDPRSNPLAALTTKEDPSPQRYDRIWIRHDKDLSVTSVDIFGKEDGGSDHYGIAASISFGTPEITTIHTSSMAPVIEEVMSLNGEDEQLEQLVRRERGYPTISQSESRSKVVWTLQKKLAIAHPTPEMNEQEDMSSLGSTKLHSVVKFQFIPVGSFGLQVDTQDSDVDILVVGNIPPKSFWSLARARLRKSTSRSQVGDPSDKTDPPDVLIRRFIKNASVPMMELTICDVRVDMQYCSAAKVLEVYVFQLISGDR
jgi:2'-5' RNA ligase